MGVGIAAAALGLAPGTALVLHRRLATIDAGARLCPVSLSARFTKDSRGSLPGCHRAVTVDAACSMRAVTAAGCDR